MNRASAKLVLTRRQTLAGLASVWVPITAPHVAAAPSPDIVARYSLGPVSSVSLLDTMTANTLDEYASDVLLPPASVLKIMTALYALEALGAEHRFRTEVRALGPVEDGTLRGGVALVGGGDPVFDANALRDLANGLVERGVHRVNGSFIVADGALPFVPEIDPTQPLHVGYNPALSGINLNFNRVRLEWARGEKDPDFRFVAPGRDFRVALAGIGGELGLAPPPVHRMQGAREMWTLPSRRMTGSGALWLPVRQPAVHTGEVFRELCAEKDLELPDAEIVTEAPKGRSLAVHASPPLAEILQAMLLYSTNLTAEIVGLHASIAFGQLPDTLAASAAEMTAWARVRYGLKDAVFVDHSGLSDRSRWSSAETVRVLEQEAEGPLPKLLRQQPLHDAEGRPMRLSHVDAAAKTGTLYFSSGLAGYLETSDRRLAFAIYSADLERRARIPQPASHAPPGARPWAGRARSMQRDLLRNWVADHLPEPPLRPRRRPG